MTLSLLAALLQDRVCHTNLSSSGSPKGCAAHLQQGCRLFLDCRLPTLTRATLFFGCLLRGTCHYHPQGTRSLSNSRHCRNSFASQAQTLACSHVCITCIVALLTFVDQWDLFVQYPYFMGPHGTSHTWTMESLPQFVSKTLNNSSRCLICRVILAFTLCYQYT